MIRIPRLGGVATLEVMTRQGSSINLERLFNGQLISRLNGSHYKCAGEAVIAKGQKVRLNELGLRFYFSNKGAPKRGHPKWDGRIGTVATLT
jgi:hypothetical protein